MQIDNRGAGPGRWLGPGILLSWDLLSHTVGFLRREALGCDASGYSDSLIRHCRRPGSIAKLLLTPPAKVQPLRLIMFCIMISDGDVYGGGGVSERSVDFIPVCVHS